MNPPKEYFRLLQTGSQYHNRRSKTARMMVLRLRKSLYGLNQFSQVWYDTVKDFMIATGFIASPLNGGLCALHDKDHGIVITAVVV
jgi:hypothetical protein